MSALLSYLDVLGAGKEQEKDTGKSYSNLFITLNPEYSQL